MTSTGQGGLATAAPGQPAYRHPQCLVCGTALAGPLGALFRAFGVRRSARNPNLCNRCNTHAEEGRVVNLTVLFADLSGFTALTHELGPERTHEVVDAFLRRASDTLVEHGAFIDKYIGDAVMAFFNVPIRYDDHCRRAVSAALDIQAELPELSARLGVDLRSSIGVATGWARVGRLGSGDGRDYTAIGDVVNLAARLQAQARPTEVMVHEDVVREMGSDVPGAAVETLTLKGFADEVRAHRVQTGSAPTGASGVERIATAEPATPRALGLGAIVFAVLGAPCAVTTLLGPLSVVVGLGSWFGALAPGIFPALDAWPVRIPLLILGTAGALAVLYTVAHARAVRLRSATDGAPLPMTRLERRRAILALSGAMFTLATVAYELYAHQFINHHSWP